MLLRVIRNARQECAASASLRRIGACRTLSGHIDHCHYTLRLHDTSGQTQQPFQQLMTTHKSTVISSAQDQASQVSTVDLRSTRHNECLHWDLNIHPCSLHSIQADASIYHISRDALPKISTGNPILAAFGEAVNMAKMLQFL